MPGYQVLTIDLGLAQFQGAGLPVVPPGVAVAAIGVEALPAAAVGLVSLHLGAPEAPALPLNLVGRNYDTPTDGGIWLDNTAVLASPSLLTLLVTLR